MESNETNENKFNFEDLLPSAETVECEELYAKANNAYEINKTTKAIAILTSIIRRNPQFGKAYSLLGEIAEKKFKDYEMAEKYYLTAIKISPKYRWGYWSYFYFLRNANRFNEAKQYIEAWSKLGVDEESVAYQYAYLLEVQGDIKQALRYYKRAAMLSTSSDFERRSSEIERCKRKLEMTESSDD